MKNLLSPELRSVSSNAFWLFLDQVLRILIGFFTFTYIARSLGPENFGQFSYSLALVALFSVFSTLGIEQIVTREFIKSKDSHEVLLSAFGLRVLGGILQVLISTITAYYLNDANISNTILVFLLASPAVFQSTDVIQFWFQSKLQAKFSVSAKLSAFVLSSILKVLAIYFTGSLLALASVYIIEALIAAVLLVSIYFYKSGEKGTSFKISTAKRLLNEGIPLLFSTVFVTIYLKIDQVILNQLTSPREIGIYAASVRISEIPFFLGTILTTTALPVIVKQHDSDTHASYENLKVLFSTLVYTALGIIAIVLILAPLIISVIYGNQYTEAAEILRIHITSLVFVFLGVGAGVYLVTHKLTHLSMIATISGAIMNVLLNFALIPLFGGRGAAIATVISYAVSGFAVNWCMKSTRELAFIQLQAFKPSVIWSVISKYIRYD